MPFVVKSTRDTLGEWNTVSMLRGLPFYWKKNGKMGNYSMETRQKTVLMERAEIWGKLIKTFYQNLGLSSEKDI